MRGGGVRCLYGRTVRPGGGFEPRGPGDLAVFETAVIPFRRIRRRWRLLPPLDRRVLRHQVKNGGNLLPGNRGDVQAWAFVVRGCLWTRMGGRAAFGAGWPGMVPAIAGAVYRRRIRRREWYRPIGRYGVPPANSPAVMSRRGDRPGGGGGGAWQGPVGALRRTPGGVLLTCSFWLYGMPPPCTGHASTTTSQSRRRTYPSRQV